MKKTVAVAMSGGVDSSYALLKLKEEGYNVFGVTLKLFCYADKPGGPKSCCSLEAIEQAKSICSSIEVFHMVVDVKKIFATQIIDYFINAYKEGLTPNPCVLCNKIIKWGYLLKKSLSCGADFFATGHYVRKEDCQKRYLLKCGLDANKDQSYYLWQLSQEELKRTLFPLGNMKKKEVQEKIKKYDMKISEKPESQEVCFIPDDDYRKFLRDSGKVKNSPGNILDLSGKVIGVHQGLSFLHYRSEKRTRGSDRGKTLYKRNKLTEKMR